MTMALLILETPLIRSTKVMGTSTMLAPASSAAIAISI
jgi:hypothetical protein